MGTGGLTFAQSNAPSGRSSATGANSDAAAKMPPVDKPETRSQDEEFRHSPKVQAMARILHIDVDTAAQIFQDLNSAILILAVLFFLFKFLPKVFRNRTATLQKQLVEARSATEEANDRLTAVEARLSKLDLDIAAIRRQSERDSQEDEQRIKRSLEDERRRIIDSAEHEIEAAGAAAQRQLKRFAAELAVDRAARGLQLTPEMDRVMIQRFGQELTSNDLAGHADKSDKAGRN